MKRFLLSSVLAFVIAIPGFAQNTCGLTGFATYSDMGLYGTTGGGNGTIVKVSTASALSSHAKDDTPKVIIIEGDIYSDESVVINIGSNKTIIGAGGGVTLTRFCLNVSGAQNIIIRNIAIKNGAPDGMAFRNSHHVWVDHCDLSNCSDGLLDFTVGSSYLTVSWTKFSDHSKATLCNSGTQHFEDRGKNRATYHHCAFINTVQRNPRIGYGLGHVYNCYWEANSSYCVGYHTGAKMVVENGYFYNTKNPFNQMYAGTDKTLPSYADALSKGNKFVSTSGNTTGTGVGFDTGLYYQHEFALNTADEVNTLKGKMGLASGIEYDPIPFPGNGAIGLPVSTKLSCGSIDGATGYQYFIGTDAENLSAYDAATSLDAGTTYFWQVKVLTANSTITSEIFRFSTADEKAYQPTPEHNTRKANLREAVSEKSPCQPMKLRWRGAFDAQSYQVYFSTDSIIDAEDLLGSTKNTEYGPGPLKYGETYFWRVDVVKADGSIVTGERWKFSSEAVYAKAGRTELEKMVRNGIVFINNPAGYFTASNNMITIGEAGPGSMSAVWNDQDGIYNVTTSYFDESDGRGWYGLYINETLKDQWTATADNEKMMTRLSKGIFINKGDEVRLEFYTENKEQGRADCMDIILDKEATANYVNENIYAKWSNKMAALQTQHDSIESVIVDKECLDVYDNFIDGLNALQDSITEMKTALEAQYAAKTLTEETYFRTAEISAALYQLLADAKKAQEEFENPTAIEAIIPEKKEMEIFTISGKKVTSTVPGQMYIIRDSDGKVFKTIAK